jgi:hypothetical protein
MLIELFWIATHEVPNFIEDDHDCKPQTDVLKGVPLGCGGVVQRLDDQLRNVLQEQLAIMEKT